METFRLSVWRRVAVVALGSTVTAMMAVANAQTFSTGANFTTITRSQTNALVGILEPPDTMGASGPDHFVTFNNGSFSIFNKNGAIVSQVSDTSFWTSALGSDPGGLSDPRILYDPASQRWFASMITTDQATNNKVLIRARTAQTRVRGSRACRFRRSAIGSRTFLRLDWTRTACTSRRTISIQAIRLEA